MSTLDASLQEYLTVRRALGFKLVQIERLLRAFVRHLDQLDEERITVDLAVEWAILPGGSDSLHYARLAAVRGFATYLHGVDPTVEIPGVEMLRNGPLRRRPFLYTDEEILALIDAAATLRTAHRTATYRTLIGLLASTGIRIGEAIDLDREHFDPRLGVIVVRGKLEKIRELPLAPSATDALDAYLARRDRPPSSTGERALFVCSPGRRLELHGAEKTFRLLRDRAGIQPRAGCRPTLHGLRHTFAIRTMLDAYRAGDDAGARLGVLSTYLGHVEPAHTYWYLHAAPELMSAAAERLERYEERER
jgi:integrase